MILINHNIYQISKFCGCDEETVLPESRKFNYIYIGYKLYATLFLKTVIDILDMCVIILKEAYTTLILKGFFKKLDILRGSESIWILFFKESGTLWMRDLCYCIYCRCNTLLYLPWCILMYSNQFVVLKYIVVKISKILHSVDCSFYLLNVVQSLNFACEFLSQMLPVKM